MSEKKTINIIKLQIQGGSATPGPPVGPKLGSKGVKAIDFCKQFNAMTQDRKGELLTVVLSVYEDKSFHFIIKSPPVASLIKKTLNITKGSGEPNRKKIGALTQEQLKQIALTKQEDTNAFDINATMKIIAGTARSMGVTISI